MSACCLQSEAPGCSAPRIGGTRIGFPTHRVRIQVKPTLRGSRRTFVGGLGQSFWDTFAKDYKPGSFTNAFQAGFTGPATVKQATDIPSFTLPYQPSLETMDVTGAMRVGEEGAATKAVAAIQGQDFDIPIPVLTPMGPISSAPSSSKAKMLGMIVVIGGVAAFAFMKFHKPKSDKPTAS